MDWIYLAFLPPPAEQAWILPDALRDEMIVGGKDRVGLLIKEYGVISLTWRDPDLL